MRLLCCALLLGTGMELHAQDPLLNRRLGPAVATSVAAIVDSAVATGLPREPLVQKALEGASKGASAEQIIDATRRLAKGMRHAREFLGEAAGDQTIVAGAVALRLGIRPEALQRFRRVSSGLELQAGLTLAVDLIQRGVPPDTSALLVETALSSSLPPADLLGMRQVIERDIRSGIAPGMAATIRARSVSAAQKR